MGTNYYLTMKVTDPCPTCGSTQPHNVELHIGKSSAGWCFSLHIYPERGINDLPDWREMWHHGVIRDEYGRELTTIEMDDIITMRKWEYRDSGGADWPKFLKDNHAVEGPNNLLRNRLGLAHGSCIRHGSGTWDLLVGDFS